MPTTDYIRYVTALLLVLGLIVLLGQIAKKYNWAQMGIKLASRSNKRLRITEIQPIDTRNRLIIAQRDDVEYVLAVSADRMTLLDKIPVPLAPISSDDSQGHPS